MINLILSLIIGAAVWVGTTFLFDSVWGGIVPFIIVFIASMAILNRKTSQKIAVIMRNVEGMMQNLASLPSEQARKNLLDKAVNELKKAYAYKHYTFFLEQQINAQIGTLYYVQRRFDEAEPYLANAFAQQSVAVCMYACILFRKKDKSGMVAAFEKAFKLSRRNAPVLWNLYAWCLLELDDRDGAIAVLNRGLAENPGDKITQDNVNSAKNGNKIQMRNFNEQWYQFWLDESAMQSFAKSILDKHSQIRSH